MQLEFDIITITLIKKRGTRTIKIKDGRNMNYSEIAKEFVISGEIANIKPFGSGHINDTFLITDENGHK